MLKSNMAPITVNVGTKLLLPVSHLDSFPLFEDMLQVRANDEFPVLFVECEPVIPKLFSFVVG